MKYFKVGYQELEKKNCDLLDTYESPIINISTAEHISIDRSEDPIISSQDETPNIS